MIEVDFKDRVPKYPGRVKMTPVPGQIDTFTMERMDEPTETGTPLDKATFESILQSRLTGRFYDLAPFSTIKKSTNSTVSMLPTSSWTVTSPTNALSGLYRVVSSSSINENYSVEKAVDGDEDTSWGSVEGTNHTYTIIFPSAITIKKFVLELGSSGDTTGINWSLNGSNNGTNWATLYSSSSFPVGSHEYTLTTTGDFNQYRFSFNVPNSPRMYITNFLLSEWTANIYTIDFLANNMPITWDVGQRVTVQIPDYAAFVVESNTLNGKYVNTILLSGRKYELRYNGSTFDAKEV